MELNTPHTVATPKKIFIIDDDADFVSLLTEVFGQAGYQVDSSTHPTQGLRQVYDSSPDLVVIDQKMPEMTGKELLGQLRKTHPTLPVVVISGFLENSSTQDFINLGVSGIFFKPLNIFALLKRLEEVFKGTVKSSGSHSPDLGLRGFTRTPFSGASKEVFVKKIHALAGFKGNLILSGEKESPFEAVAGEIVKKSTGDQLILWHPGLATPDKLNNAIATATSATLLVLNTEKLTAAEQAAFYQISKREGPWASGLQASLRFIFCLAEELDAIYEKGVIDDKFYLFLGSLELKMPKLATPHNLHKAEGLSKAAAKLEAEMKAGGRILVLDDEDLHAQMVVDLLEASGFAAIKTSSPTEGLLALKKERFCLIITDFRMPGINGVDFVAQARQIDPTLPVLVVTGNIQVPEMVRIGNMGITRLIQKPIDTAKFIDEVKNVVRV